MKAKQFTLALVLTFQACLLSANDTQAQSDLPVTELQGVPTLPTDRHELYVGYGLLSLPQMICILGDAFSDSFTNDQSSNRFLGPIAVGYNYFPSDKLSLGIGANYANYSEKAYSSNRLDSRIHFITVMPQFQYYWARLSHVEFYSGIKVGASLVHGKEEIGTVIPAFHVTPLGARIGRKKRIYIDSGTGFDGLLNIGYNIPMH